MSALTDRELLELAAKAHGAIRITPRWQAGLHAILQDDERDGAIWNPLTDDGDALRLAVKLGMVIAIDSDGMTQVIANDADVCEPLGSDPYAATRRAIVRAAAALTQGA